MDYPKTLQAIPPDLVCLDDYEQFAAQQIPSPYFEYIHSGVADERLLHRNRDSFSQLDILPRLLRDFRDANSATSLFDQILSAPILLAPVAHQRLVHPDGELATARGAAAVDVPMVVSTLASQRLEDIARAGAPGNWFQLYLQARREDSLSLLRRAEDAGYRAIVVTLDTPVNGLRNRSQRAGFALPPEVSEVNLANVAPPPGRQLHPGQSIVLNGIMADAPDWETLHWLRQQCSLPLLVKGVMHPDDARELQAAGIDGLVISNHGGRSLDAAPTPLSILPAIRGAVGNDYPLLMDGGIRRGSDVFKALALGANAVMIGRPQVYALATAGALGVAHMLKLLIDELHITMALAGCPRLDTIQRHCLHTPRPLL